MLEIGACKAKTHFSSLLDRVVQGEEVLITKHGRAPSPDLFPPGERRPKKRFGNCGLFVRV